MGKPFKKELENISSTIEWAFDQPVELLTEFFKTDSNTPLFIVGSGGSLSACYFAASLYQKYGTIAKAITPLELFYTKEALKNSKILFISASGKNTDILFSFDIAIRQEPKEIFTFCMKKNTLLSKAAKNYSRSKSIEFDIPTKKDGFLATNTLAAYFALLLKSYGFNSPSNTNDILNKDFLLQIKKFVEGLTPFHSLTILYGGWGQSVAYDIESKFTEAALGNVLLADYRNFGHGRHHWFAKRENSSALLALVTPREKQIAEKSLALVPNSIPKLVIESTTDSAVSSIELLVKAFQLVKSFGEIQDIDPGKPGVPEFGSKLYHMKYSSFYKLPSLSRVELIEETAILRKMGQSITKLIPETLLTYWKNKFSEFVNRLQKAKFTSIVFDYDGTLCSFENRYDCYLDSEIVNELNKLLEAGIIIGIATGRGQSVRTALRNSNIPAIFWKNIFIGYYNGASIGSLDEDSCPDLSIKPNEELLLFEKQISNFKFPYSDLKIKLRPYQLTIETTNILEIDILREVLNSFMITSLTDELLLLESSHSFDIIVKSRASKLNVVNKCRQVGEFMNLNGECLTIGDKGRWPGNDYALLSTPFSLSVDEVSLHPDTCWNLSDVSITGTLATINYLHHLNLENDYFTFSL